MEKLYDRINWHNNTTPAINETNLNLMSKAVDDIDDRVIDIAADVLVTVPQIQAYLEQADDLVEALELMTANPPYIGANGHWYTWDTETEAYTDSGIDASITVQIADITMLSPDATPYVTNTGTDTDPVFHLFIPRGKGISSIAKTATSGLVDIYTITYSDGYTTTFTVTNGKSAYQCALDGGYIGTEAEFEADLGNFKTYADNAEDSAEDSEAWAVGKRIGEDVPSTDPAYQNNSKYYAGQASTSATAANSSKTDAKNWAVGPSGSGTGTDTNNAKYWAEQAAASAGGGVTSFNTRTGAVTPQSGDYTAAQVGAVPTSNIKNTYQSSPTANTEVYDAAYINNLAGCEAVQITTSGWSPGTTSVAGKSCFYKSITLSKAVYGIPEVKLKPANGVPTESEENLFNCLDYYGVDSASPNTLKVYAVTKPTTAFYIWVIRNGGRV